MNKIKLLTLAGKAIGVLSMLDFVSMIPGKWGLALFVSSSLLKDAVNRFGDLLDNQKLDGSFKV